MAESANFKVSTFNKHFNGLILKRLECQTFHIPNRYAAYFNDTMTHIRNLILIVVYSSLSLTGCAQTDKKDIIFDWKAHKENFWISIDTTYQLYTPSIDEIVLAKELSIQYIDSLEKIREKKKSDFGTILQFNHSDYYRQYVGYIANEGNKVIYINAICAASGDKNDLKKTWWFVLDGGSCYYQIRIDLKAKKCFDFSVNGEA